MQAVPSGSDVYTQAPLAGSQTPAGRQESRLGGQITQVDPRQTPATQVSEVEHALPSLQADPSAFAGLEQAPVPGSQVPATWHVSSAVQVTGFEPVQTPDWQVSFRVHALPSLQALPLATIVQSAVLTAGWQDSQTLAGFGVPGA